MQLEIFSIRKDAIDHIRAWRLARVAKCHVEKFNQSTFKF